MTITIREKAIRICTVHRPNPYGQNTAQFFKIFKFLVHSSDSNEHLLIDVHLDADEEEIFS